MKYTILMGQAGLITKIRPPQGGLFIPNVVKALRERYGFVRVPQAVQDGDISQGLILEHGNFTWDGPAGKESIVIDRLRIFNDGIIVDTKSLTWDAERVLVDLLAWGPSAFNVVIDTEQMIKAYFSQLEVVLPDIENYLAPSKTITNIGHKVANFLASSGFQTPPWHPSGFVMHCDTTEMKPLKVLPFVIERRVGFPYSEHTYFSQAPLQTTDHLNILQELIDAPPMAPAEVETDLSPARKAAKK